MRIVLLTMTVLLVSACGGGGTANVSGNGNAPSSITIQGVAATGAAISGGTVDVKCKKRYRNSNN